MEYGRVGRRLRPKIIMNVALARTFVAVVETGGFASAGVQENVAQSTVSMRIKGLEDRLGKT